MESVYRALSPRAVFCWAVAVCLLCVQEGCRGIGGGIKPAWVVRIGLGFSALEADCVVVGRLVLLSD